ncbi:MAG: recombinase family protein [Nitrospirae bacterium]|nr:MAG: recombinase family protein [Nitrospirota bacterium]
MKRAAIYLRVSSEEQTYENQRPDVERVVRTRGYELVRTYEEQAGAAKARSAFARLMADAHQGLFDVLVVWAFDRFGRSMTGNMQAVLDLDRRGVTVVSVREPWLDTQGAVRPLLIAIFSWVAEQEREQLVARTVAGMARARKKGVRIGRPEMPIDKALVRALHAQGESVRQISQRLRVPKTTVHRALRRPERGGSEEPTQVCEIP